VPRTGLGAHRVRPVGADRDRPVRPDGWHAGLMTAPAGTSTPALQPLRDVRLWERLEQAFEVFSTGWRG